MIRSVSIAFAMLIAGVCHPMAYGQDPATAASAEWIRGSYHNGVKHGAVGAGLAIARRQGERPEYALVVELLGLRPVRFQKDAALRIISDGAVLMELPPAATDWQVVSEIGARIKGHPAFTARRTYPLDADQLARLHAAGDPVLEILHGEGMIELKLRRAELEALLEFAR